MRAAVEYLGVYSFFRKLFGILVTWRAAKPNWTAIEAYWISIAVLGNL